MQHSRQTTFLQFLNRYIVSELCCYCIVAARLPSFSNYLLGNLNIPSGESLVNNSHTLFTIILPFPFAFWLQPPPGRHHSGVSLLIRRFAQKAIATAMFQCKPLFLFILGPIVLGLIRNPIWQDSGGLASSFNFQSLESAFRSEFLICSLLNF